MAEEDKEKALLPQDSVYQRFCTTIRFVPILNFVIDIVDEPPTSSETESLLNTIGLMR